MTVSVVGGGLAGAAAACALAAAGRAVVLFEREAVTSHKICGEFVSHEAQGYLARLGVDLAALGARRIETVRLVRGCDVVEARLPFRGASLTRRRLDAALLARAETLGVEVRRGQAVRGLDELDGGTVLLATGKHELRGARRVPAHPPPDLVGFKTYFHLDAGQLRALEGTVEVVLFRDSYAGLQMVEGGLANLCLLADRSRLASAGGTWDGLLADLLEASPHLRRRLAGAAPALDRPLAISRVPYGFLHRPSATDRAGLFRVGDQMAVIPSFSGDGMAIALHSAASAASAIIAGQTEAAHHRRMRRELRGQLMLAQAMYRCGRTLLGQSLMMSAARMWPGTLGLAAAATRVPEAALRRVAAN